MNFIEEKGFTADIERDLGITYDECLMPAYGTLSLAIRYLSNPLFEFNSEEQNDLISLLQNIRHALGEVDHAIFDARQGLDHLKEDFDTEINLAELEEDR